MLPAQAGHSGLHCPMVNRTRLSKSGAQCPLHHLLKTALWGRIREAFGHDHPLGQKRNLSEEGWQGGNQPADQRAEGLNWGKKSLTWKGQDPFPSPWHFCWQSWVLFSGYRHLQWVCLQWLAISPFNPSSSIPTVPEHSASGSPGVGNCSPQPLELHKQAAQAGVCTQPFLKGFPSKINSLVPRNSSRGGRWQAKAHREEGKYKRWPKKAAGGRRAAAQSRGCTEGCKNSLETG